MLILIKGTGEIASAVAVTLHRAGERVVLVDGPAPAEPRRGMAFTEAVYQGHAELEGVTAVRLDSLEALPQHPADTLPVLVGDGRELAAALQPAIVVDARMRKHVIPEPQIGEAPLVIALGPGVRVGVTADLAIETNRGPNEGAVLTAGETEPNTGRTIPEHLPANNAPRFAYAPADGTWETALTLGDAVEEGTVLGRVGEAEVRAPVAGTLRGISRPGAPVTQHQRIADIDPWRTTGKAWGITRHSRVIAEGVLQAIREHSPTT